MFHLTDNLISRLHRASMDLIVRRALAMEKLDGNPLGAEVAWFGDLAAVKFRDPALGSKNYILNLTEQSLASVDDALTFFRQDNIRCGVAVPQMSMSSMMAQHLAQREVFCIGASVNFLGQPRCDMHVAEQIEVRRLRDDVDLELFLDLFLEGNEISESTKNR